MVPNALMNFSPEDIQQGVRYSWETGVLNYRRRNTQKYLKMKSEQAKRVSRKIYWETTRRLGKSTEMLQTFTEHCIQRPSWSAGFFAPVKEGLLDYIEPIVDDVFSDCPENLRPYFNRSRFMLTFPNRAVIKFRGSNNKQHRVRRGNDYCEAGVDECRDVDQLDQLIDSVIFPSLFNNEGYVYMSSTPADTRSHPLYRYRQQAESGGWLIPLTIWDANRMDPFVYPLARIEEWQRETQQSVDGQEKWEREYECKWVVNKSRAAVPEWVGAYIQETPRDPYYPFYQHYIAIDWGYRDFTAIGFATYLYRQAKLQVEGELAFSGQDVRSDRIAAAIASHAQKLWGPEWDARMVSDSADPILINELNAHPKMSFVPVQKEHTLEAMLNQFRVLVSQSKVLVSMKCPLTLHCLANAIWDQPRKKLDQDVFARHFDHLMQLVYMTRILDVVSNPIPNDFMIDGTRVIDLNFDKQTAKTAGALAIEQAFGNQRGRYR